MPEAGRKKEELPDMEEGRHTTTVDLVRPFCVAIETDGEIPDDKADDREKLVVLESARARDLTMVTLTY